MTWSLLLLRVCGVPIRLHATFGLLAAFVAWRAMTTAGPLAAATEALLVALLLVCVVLHELGHTVVALKRGVPITAITLYPFGGVATLGRRIPSGRLEIEIAAAGPAVNLALAGLFFVLIGGRALDPGPSPGLRVLWLLLWANLLMAGFNLLPAFPLDGGRVLRGALSTRIGEVRATVWSASIGQIGSVLLIGLGFFHEPWLILAGLLVFPGANAELHRALGVSRLERLTVGDIMLTTLESIDAHTSLEAAADRSRATPLSDFVVCNGPQWVGYLPAGRLWSLLHNGCDGSTAIGDVALPLAPPLAASAALAEAIDSVRRSECPAAPVRKDDELVGLITLASLDRATSLVRAVSDRE